MTHAAETNVVAPSWAARHPKIIGALLLLGLHAAFVPLGAAPFGLKPEASVLLIGVTQLVYVVPTLILLLKLGRAEMAKGMAWAALATFVVNAAGCAAFLAMLSRIDG